MEEKITINGKTYTRPKGSKKQWTGEDGNIYTIHNGQAIPLTKTKQDYVSGWRGFVNAFLPSQLKLSQPVHVPVQEVYVDKGGTPSNDNRTHAQRNADRVKDMDSSNPIVRAKYTILEDPKEGVTDGLKRTWGVAGLGASIPYALSSIPGFLYTTGGLVGGMIGGTIGNNIGQTIASTVTDDDEIIRNSGKTGETMGSFIGASKLNYAPWLLRQARGAVANNVTPQGYENEATYGMLNKSKIEEGFDALKQMFSWKGLTEGTTMKPGQIPLWMQRAEQNGSDISFASMPYFRNIVWKKALKQPLTYEESSLYVPITGKRPSIYDLFWNAYSRKKPLESYDNSVVQTYNLEHPAILEAFNRNNQRKTGGKWTNFSDLYDFMTRLGTDKNGYKDWFTTNGGNIGLKYNPVDDTYSMIDGWDIQPFKDQDIAYPIKSSISKILDSKYVPGGIKDAVQNFEVVSQLGGRPIIWKQELTR